MHSITDGIKRAIHWSIYGLLWIDWAEVREGRNDLFREWLLWDRDSIRKEWIYHTKGEVNPSAAAFARTNERISWLKEEIVKGKKWNKLPEVDNFSRHQITTLINVNLNDYRLEWENSIDSSYLLEHFYCLFLCDSILICDQFGQFINCHFSISISIEFLRNTSKSLDLLIFLTLKWSLANLIADNRTSRMKSANSTRSNFPDLFWKKEGGEYMNEWNNLISDVEECSCLRSFHVIFL